MTLRGACCAREEHAPATAGPVREPAALVSDTLGLAGLDFLAPAPALAPARSPLAGPAERAGGRLGEREGWTVAVVFADAQPEARAIAETVGVADASHLSVHEGQGAGILSGEEGTAPGCARRRGGAWYCPLHPRRALLVDGPSPGPGWLDLTSAFAGLSLIGPLARDVLARVSALDLRPGRAPISALRPGSVARTPAMVLREDEDVYLLRFGAAFALYMWTAVVDAAQRLGGAPIGVDAALTARRAALGEPAPGRRRDDA